MHNVKIRTVVRYVFPTMLSNFCFVLFTVIDAIFVGRGVGTDALGAINLVNPFVMVVSAVNLFISIGGVAICAVRMGEGDTERGQRGISPRDAPAVLRRCGPQPWGNDLYR